MNDSAIGRVLSAAISRKPSDVWIDRAPLIGVERDAVDANLDANGAVPVYGFTTLLGDLDDSKSVPSDQSLLFEGHLIGERFAVPEDLVHVITACKLEQLSHGGSGISLGGFQDLLTFPFVGGDAVGAWLASYGSGDVVPAAWWYRSAINPPHGAIPRGNLIASINGNFVSTAYSLMATLEAMDVICDVLSLYSRVAVRGKSSSPIVNSIAARFSKVPDSASQLPVSMRDCVPVVSFIVDSIEAVFKSIDHRLRSISANPVFRWDDKVMRPVSQSSFLDFQLTSDLTGLLQAQHLALGLTQRIIALDANVALLDGTPSNLARLQPPKVANAIVGEAELLSGVLPNRFFGWDSSGVEDLRDLSLLTAVQVMALTSRMRAMAGVATAESGALPNRLEFRDILRSSVSAAMPPETWSTVIGVAQNICRDLVRR